MLHSNILQYELEVSNNNGRQIFDTDHIKQYTLRNIYIVFVQFGIFLIILFLQLEFHIKHQKQMAFVFRSNSTPLHIISTPGPGQYQLSNIKQTNYSIVPFNQSSPRQIWKENTIPGPGSYQLNQSKSSCKGVIKNCGNTYAIYESPVQSSIFKSNSNRFNLNEQQVPGPGQYSFEIQKPVKEKSNLQSNSLQKYLQKCRLQDQPQKQVGLLAIGQEEQLNRSSAVQSCHVKKQKKIVPFQSKQERSKPLRPQTSLGPGSYEVDKIFKKQGLQNRKKTTQSIAKFKKVPPSQFIKQIQKSQSKLKNSQIRSSKKSFNKKKDDFFGSSVSRFNSTNGLKTPGPGEYEIECVKPTINENSHCKKTAFGRKSQQTIMRQIFVSPFIKVQRNERQQIQKINRKKQGCFVSKQPRFKEIKRCSTSDSHLPPNQNLFLGKQNGIKQKQMKRLPQKNPIKLSINKDNLKKNESDTRPLSYACDAFTIASKNKSKCQINAPFLSHANRFNQNEKESHGQFQNFYIQKNSITQTKDRDSPNCKSSTAKGIMDSQNPRFNYNFTQNQLSPFSYNPQKPKSKQFNKLFI